MNVCPDELQRLYRQQRVIPFVGAGCSMSVSWDVSGVRKSAPSWSQLVSQAARLLNSEPDLLRARGIDLQILEYFSLKKGGTAELTNWMSNELSAATDADILQSPIMSSLAKLDKCRCYYTTNYDNFLDRAICAVGRKVQVVTEELSVNHDPSQVDVIKFHGDFNSPHTMVVSESNYLKRMRLETAMDFKLRADMLGRAVLFVGYSFNDPNVNYIFHLVQEMFKSLPGTYNGKRAYIILPDPSEFERQLFNARNIEVVAVGRDNLSENTATVLSLMSE